MPESSALDDKTSIGQFSPMLIRLVAVAFWLSILPGVPAEIPWPEVVKRLADENARLARRPQGHNGEYFVACTLYFTPMESGFTFERGFDVTPITRPGLHGRKYPRDFLRAVKMEGCGKISTPVSGHRFIRYHGDNSYRFASEPASGGQTLVPRSSAAARPGQSGLGRRGAVIETASPELKKAFGSTRWTVFDTGSGLRLWQIDLYYGEDEPLGPGRSMTRPRSTPFEYAYSNVQIVE
ncbi:MAG: hypothetical protein ABI925_07405 [Verrucomicrobiota bacterium]